MVEKAKPFVIADPQENPNPRFPVEGANLESASNLSDRLRTCMDRVGGGGVLAKRSGVPRSTLETYLTGKAEPKVSRVVAIAKASGVSLEWLATGEGAMEPGADVAYPVKERGPGYGPGVEGGPDSQEPAGLDHLDEGLLTAAVIAVDQYLEDRGLSLDAARKAQLIGLLYDIVYDEEQADRDRAMSKNVTRLFKLVS